MEQLPVWFLLGVPLGCMAFALIGLAWLTHEGRKLDRLDGKRG